MERKRKVDLGDDDPSPAGAAGTSGGGSDSARKRQANGGGGGGENGNAQAAAAANGKHMREFDESATVSPYTGRDYSKKYFDILEKRKGKYSDGRRKREGERGGKRETEGKRGRESFFFFPHQLANNGDKKGTQPRSKLQLSQPFQITT